MIDLLFFAIIILALVIMIWLGRKEEISVLMMFAGVFAVLIGMFAMLEGVGTITTITTNSTSLDCAQCTIYTDTSTTQSYTLPTELTNCISILFILLGMWILIDEMIAAVQNEKWKWRWR